MHGFFDRLSFANVVASLALFVSLGGASYAAIALQPNSVGPQQLRAGAVTPRALGFPLAVRGVTDSHTQDLTKGPCNAPHRPGEVVNVLCPRPASVGLLAPGRETHLSAHQPAQAFVTAVVGLQNHGLPDTSATVNVQIILDGHRVAAASDVVLTGGERVQAPIQALLPLSRGQHTVGVQLGASYDSYEPGDVVVSPVSLISTLLPHG